MIELYFQNVIFRLLDTNTLWRYIIQSCISMFQHLSKDETEVVHPNCVALGIFFNNCGCGRGRALGKAARRLSFCAYVKVLVQGHIWVEIETNSCSCPLPPSCLPILTVINTQAGTVPLPCIPRDGVIHYICIVLVTEVGLFVVDPGPMEARVGYLSIAKCVGSHQGSDLPSAESELFGEEVHETHIVQGASRESYVTS